MIKIINNGKRVIITLTMILFGQFSSFVFSQNCILPDGKYKVEFDKQFKNHPEFDFEISGEKIVFNTESNENYFEHKIEKNDQCYLVIEKEIVNEENLNELQKVLNQQHPYYNFKEINENEYEFIYRVDLHIMINSGKFIKQK
ncbi:MAG: hypothetical protein CVU07_10590 [Bacteroidetes bacterium HGW-Bacteroidetes-23]|nr:MAG: hypothetical protein CVU07_10590 [Bacteroidetes bacterium HGW-Bacteroidetes-23]